MPLLSCSGRSIIPDTRINVDAPHCHWCNGKNFCYDPKEEWDAEEAYYNADQYRYLMEDFADDAVGTALRCE